MKSGSCSDEYNRCTFVLQRKLSDTPVITKETEILIGTVAALSINPEDALNGNFQRILISEDTPSEIHESDSHSHDHDHDHGHAHTSESGAQSLLTTAAATIATLLLF